jgi:hypothetical protein
MPSVLMWDEILPTPELAMQKVQGKVKYALTHPVL